VSDESKPFLYNLASNVPPFEKIKTNHFFNVMFLCSQDNQCLRFEASCPIRWLPRERFFVQRIRQVNFSTSSAIHAFHLLKKTNISVSHRYTKSSSSTTTTKQTDPAIEPTQRKESRDRWERGWFDELW
jgi:hypothetical protein